MSEDIDEMEKMLSEYLQFASSGAKEKSGTFDLSELVENIINKYENPNISKNYNKRIYFNGRKNLIQRCINNLIDNSIKYGENINLIIEKQVLDRIGEFRSEFKARPGWEKGSPKRANNVTKYTDEEKKKGKANMPGHVRASMNWNNCKQMYGDKYSLPILDGAKVIVCKLKNNPLNYTSIAYPTDELRIPEWFKELPFDSEAMEQTILNQKIERLLICQIFQKQ